MRTFLLPAIIVTLAAICMPASAAWGIQTDDAQPVAAAPVAQQVWADNLAPSGPIASPILEASSAPGYVVVATPQVEVNAFVKTENDMRVLNTTAYNYKSTGLLVPEPGSIGAISAGLIGLLALVARSRKRS